MKEKNLPREVMRNLAEGAWLFSGYDNMRRYQKPGEYYLAQGPVTRSLLKELKSDDIADVRWPFYDNPDSGDRKK